MDYGTALAVWLGFVAVAVTVTPKITNRWAAAGAWMLTILYSAWLFGSRRAEALAFFGQHPTLLVLGVGGIVLICLMALRERDRRVKRFAADAEAAAESERQREFESFPAELGMYEHAKNLKESLDAFPPLMHRMAPVVVKIGAEVIATVDRFPPKSDPDFIDKKAAVISQAARGPLHDLVSELERDATAYLGKADLFATSFRHFLTIPIRSDSDRETLGDMRDVFARHAFVEMFGKLGEVFEQKANAMLKLHGHTQDMNRIVGRYTQAMGKVRDANRNIHAFSTGELPTAVSAKLSGEGDANKSGPR